MHADTELVLDLFNPDFQHEASLLADFLITTGALDADVDAWTGFVTVQYEAQKYHQIAIMAERGVVKVYDADPTGCSRGSVGKAVADALRDELEQERHMRCVQVLPASEAPGLQSHLKIPACVPLTMYAVCAFCSGGIDAVSRLEGVNRRTVLQHRSSICQTLIGLFEELDAQGEDLVSASRIPCFWRVHPTGVKAPWMLGHYQRMSGQEA